MLHQFQHRKTPMKVAETGFRRDIIHQIWICDEARIEVLTVYPRAKRVQVRTARSRRVFVQVTSPSEAIRPSHEGAPSGRDLFRQATRFWLNMGSSRMLRRVQQFQLDSRQTLSIVIRTHDMKDSLVLLFDTLRTLIERAFGKS